MNTVMQKNFLFGGAFVWFACAAMGCSESDRPTLGMVVGTVTLDGQPLPQACVLFTPVGPGRTSQGTTDTAGRYALLYLRDIAGANLGEHAVRITTASEDNGGKESLPTRYHQDSKLIATVDSGSNTLDFILESQ